MHIIVSRLYWSLAIRNIPSLVGQRTSCGGNCLTLDSESYENSDLNSIFKMFPPTVYLDAIFVHFDLCSFKIEKGILSVYISLDSFRFNYTQAQKVKELTVRAKHANSQEAQRSSSMSRSQNRRNSLCPVTKKAKK